MIPVWVEDSEAGDPSLLKHSVDTRQQVDVVHPKTGVDAEDFAPGVATNQHGKTYWDTLLPKKVALEEDAKQHGKHGSTSMAEEPVLELVDELPSDPRVTRPRLTAEELEHVNAPSPLAALQMCDEPLGAELCHIPTGPTPLEVLPAFLHSAFHTKLVCGP